jgi:N-acetylglucosamine repressor
MNRSLVLNTLRRDGRLSRTQLTDLSGLSVGAVSQITNELLASNWVMEVGEGEYTGGRRQTLLKLNPHAGCAVGIKLMEDRVFGAITDLESRVLYYDVWHALPDHDPQSVSLVLAQIVRDIIARSGVSDRLLMGVGVGLAGAINPHEGVVHSSPFFGWRNVPLASLLEQQINFPVFIENDVNTLSFAEQLFGPGQHRDNFLVITVGRGIGLGIVINGEVYQGARGGVGEIGHITLDPVGPRCDCGKNGCLEALAADPAVLLYVQKGLKMRGEPDAVLPQTLADIVDAARNGHGLAREALARSGRYLGIGVATAVNLLCPSLIILSGEGIVAGDFRLQPMFDALHEHTFDGLLKDVEVVVQPLDDHTWARGAASLVISRLFESPRLESLVITD